MSEISDVTPGSYRLAPDRLAIGLLLTVEVFLLLSDRFCWFAFNHYQGWTALIAIGAVGLTLLLMLLWFVTKLLLRRLFQYSLSSLLLLVVAAAIACSLLATELQRERGQVEAANAINRDGGAVVFCTPTLLGRVLRDDSLVNVHWVSFSRRPITNAALVHLRKLPYLSTLTLDGTKITDEGLIHLRGLRHLYRLYLNNTSITDAGLAHLRELKELRDLRLGNTQVTDAGLVHCRGLSQLRNLSLKDTNITDAGLVHLYGLGHLVEVYAVGTKVTEEGEKKLRQALPQCLVFY